MGEDYPDHTYLSSYKAAGQQASSTPSELEHLSYFLLTVDLVEIFSIKNFLPIILEIW
jgi:hypothetical protein